MWVLLTNFSIDVVLSKRKSAASEASAGKKQCVDDGDDVADSSHDKNLDDEGVDDKEAVRNATMIVRLPTQAPNTLPSSVIVIDDSDDETDVPVDRKPDRHLLDEQIAEHSASNLRPPLTASVSAETNHEHIDDSQQTLRQKADVDGNEAQTQSLSCGDGEMAESVVQSSNCTSFPSSEAQPCSSKSLRRAKRVQNPKAIGNPCRKKLMTVNDMQTEIDKQDVSLQTDACGAEQKLESLRSNVLQLLKTIVPSLTCNNLEFVDELVVEMVRVNAENSNIDN